MGKYNKWHIQFRTYNFHFEITEGKWKDYWAVSSVSSCVSFSVTECMYMTSCLCYEKEKIKCKKKTYKHVNQHKQNKTKEKIYCIYNVYVCNTYNKTPEQPVAKLCILISTWHNVHQPLCEWAEHQPLHLSTWSEVKIQSVGFGSNLTPETVCERSPSYTLRLGHDQYIWTSTSGPVHLDQYIWPREA